ncbi:tkl protein kinase [Ophiostoma piceae UAMH 11346]|uniref:Tkl protein kinase n=1 Tax=Ophiostoma piceae (strain UAMH 11346) TaxID=1262450 RepID=S3CCJ3_OPHP1|nr:tkl protein kinase [Ophiostoma piceae UAMH 11346]
MDNFVDNPDRYIARLPTPTKIHDLIGAGASFATVYLPPDRVIKREHASYARGHASYERSILEQLGPHPRLVRYFGMWNGNDWTVVLEYHPRGALRQILMDSDPSTDLPRRKYARQMAEGLAFMHRRGFVHGDFNGSNALVTNGDDIVLCDFAASGRDGEQPQVACFETRHFRPRSNPEEQQIRCVQDDIFALGSALYELYTHHKPYADKDDATVERLYREGKFPGVDNLELGPVIRKCWTGGYTTMDEVIPISLPMASVLVATVGEDDE